MEGPNLEEREMLEGVACAGKIFNKMNKDITYNTHRYHDLLMCWGKELAIQHKDCYKALVKITHTTGFQYGEK